MLNNEFRETTKPLLRPDQVKDNENEVKRLSGMIDPNNHASKVIQDKAMVRTMLHNVKRDLETQRPTAYSHEELDSAVAREAYLREEFIAGMPTAAEMRKAPPGTLSKNIAWEKRNKSVIMEWKNIRKRLHASGDLKGIDRMDSYGVSNVEMYRPTGGSQEGNMNNAVIPGKQYYMDDIPSSVVFTDDDIEKLKTLDPELAKGLAVMSAEGRAAIKEIIHSYTLTTGEGNVSDVIHCAKPGCKNTVPNEGDLCKRWHQPKE